MVTAVTIDIYHVKETIVRYLLYQPFQQSFCVGADPSWLVEEQESKSLLEVEKALEHRGFLLGGDFSRTFDKNKQEDSHASGNCPPSTSETGLFLPRLGSDLGRKRAVGRSPRPRRGPAPVVAPPPPSRACSVGRVGPAGLRGLPQLPASAQPVDGGSLSRDWFQGSYVRKPASEEPPGGLRGRPEAPGASQGQAGGADVSGL